MRSPSPPTQLTASAWAPFGWLPRADTDPATASDTLHFEWADAHLNTIEHTLRRGRATAADGLRCAVMFRHDTHTQALTPLDARSVLAVAPASVDFSAPADLDAIRAFVLEPGETLVLHRGTWHWGPFPVTRRARCGCSTCRDVATPRTTRASTSPRAPAGSWWWSAGSARRRRRHRCRAAFEGQRHEVRHHHADDDERAHTAGPR